MGHLQTDNITNFDGSVVVDVTNPLAYDYLNNQVTGEKINIELNPDIKVDKIEPQEVSSSLPFEIAQKSSLNKKEIKKFLGLNNGNVITLVNNTTREKVELKGTTIKESFSKTSINDKNYNDYCSILYNVKKIFETSQKILSHNDIKKISDLKYSRYANIARINNNEYLVEIVIKGVDKLTLYSITPIKNDVVKRVDNSSQHDIVNNSITHIQDTIKSKLVQKYNNDYQKAIKNNKPENVFYQPGYHGSAAKFDKFDDDFIGSGEGAQVHGYGHYVAKAKNVSEIYRRKLTQSVEDIIYNGEKLNINSDEYNVIVSIDNFRDVNNDTFEKAQEAYIKHFKWTAQSENEAIRDYAEKRIKIAESIDAKKIKYDGKGQLYQVEIPDDDVLLDEDNLLSEQEDNIQEKIKKVAQQIYQDRLNFNINTINSREFELINNVKDNKFFVQGTDCTGRDFYKSLAKILGSDKKTSLLLNEYGIKGIKYNGNVDGDCFVVFDPQNIEITRTFYQSGVNEDKQINVDENVFVEANEDVTLPNVNNEILKNLGKGNKPLVLKANIIKKNKTNHPEILIGEYNDILSKGLQNTDLVFKTDNKNEYYNFVHFDNSTNEQILVELSENKDNYEIVNFYKFSDKSLERKIKKANNEGGQFLITDSNTKGAAVLSALEVSPDNIITINSSKNNPKRVGYVFQEPNTNESSVEENDNLIAGYSYQEVMNKLNSLYDELDKISSENEQKNIMSKIHVLEDAFEIFENSEKYSEKQISDTALNAYYVMNNQNLPEEFIETDQNSQRTYSL